MAGEEVREEEGGKQKIDDMFVILLFYGYLRFEACLGLGKDYFHAGV